MNGPLLIHERLDYWLSMIFWANMNAISRRKISYREVLPPWIQLPLGDPEEGFARLMEIAEGNDADDINVDR